MSELRGRPRLGVYEPLLELAAGGLGTVDIALHRGVVGFERLVVTKRLHKFVLKNSDALPMFRDEARVASSIRHPNVVPVIDVIEAPGELLLVMEYIEGISVSALRKACTDTREPVAPAVAARIISDALAGLHGAHEAIDVRGRPLHIVHRDVSPQNILVGIDGTSRLIDFGIAKAAGRLTETQSGYIKGKAAYMSPEQVDSTEIDRRSDVFSAAIVLFELLTGRRLFDAESDIATLRKVLKGEIPDPSSLVHGVPRALDSVLQCALARNREHRFATALAFQTALESAVAPAPAREVGALVQRVCGPVLEARRRALADALGGTDRLVKTMPDSAIPLARTLPSPSVAPFVPRTLPESDAPLFFAQTSPEASAHGGVPPTLPEVAAQESPGGVSGSREKEAPAEGDTRVSSTADVSHLTRSRARVWLFIPSAAIFGLSVAAAAVYWPRGQKGSFPVSSTESTPEAPSSTVSSPPPPSASIVSSFSPAAAAGPTAAQMSSTPAAGRSVDAGARRTPRAYGAATSRAKGDDLRHDFDPGHPF